MIDDQLIAQIRGLRSQGRRIDQIARIVDWRNSIVSLEQIANEGQPRRVKYRSGEISDTSNLSDLRTGRKRAHI